MFIQGTHAAQYEREARGFVWLWPGIYIPSAATVATIERRWVVVTQEQPWHPGSFTWFWNKGIPAPGQPTTNTQSAFVKREEPWHPTGFVGAPPQAPLLPLPPGRRIWQVTQEQPWYPGSWIQGGPQPSGPTGPVRRTTLVTQEQPWHPGPFVWFGVVPINVVPGRGTVQGYIL